MCHLRSTGPEIWHDTDGKVDILVSCVGSGATVTGIARYFKEKRRHALQCVAVEPANSAALSGGTPGQHQITGIGAGFITELLDVKLIDEVVTVTEEEAFEMPSRLAREEGILCGIASFRRVEGVR